MLTCEIDTKIGSQKEFVHNLREEKSNDANYSTVIISSVSNKEEPPCLGLNITSFSLPTTVFDSF